MKKKGHYCRICSRHRANEKFSGKGHAKHICKDCDREHRAEKRAQKKAFDSRVVFVQIIARPERKLVLKRVAASSEIFEHWSENGGEIRDELKTISFTMSEPLGLWIPPAMRSPEALEFAWGVEVSANHNGSIPKDFEIIELPACWMMAFQGPPYDKGRVGEAIKVVRAAIKRFDPEVYGYEWAGDDAPRLYWEPVGCRGYIEAWPVRPGKCLGILHWA